MTTQKQIEANRNNAALSTGPKSAEGKTIVGINALKHGIFSNKMLIDGESQNEFDSLKQAFYDHFQPQGFLEMLFWERTLAAAWRLGRITKMESMLMNYVSKESFNSQGLIEVLNECGRNQLSLLSRYEITLEKILFRSLSELKALQNARSFDQSKCDVEIGFVPQK